MSASGTSRSPAAGTGEICESVAVLGSINHLTHTMETSRRRLQEKDLPLFAYYSSTPLSVRVCLAQDSRMQPDFRLALPGQIGTKP